MFRVLDLFEDIRSIPAALLKIHGNSINDEGLRTFVAETEAIINSRPLSDVSSEIRLSPSNLFIMKSDVITP